MYQFESVIMLMNIFLAMYIAGKIRIMKEVNLQNQQIQSRIEQTVIENTEIVTIIIEQLETKLAEVGNIISSRDLIEEKIDNAIVTCERNIQKQNQSRILYMKKQGLSVQEIAEKLKIPQGEVKLKIDLHEKMSPNAESS